MQRPSILSKSRIGVKNKLLIASFSISIFICIAACNLAKHKDEHTFFFQRIDDEIIIDSDLKIPKPLGWTNDYAEVFTENEIKYLDSLSTDYEKKTSVEIAIATIPSVLTSDSNFEHYTLSILNEWGIGKDVKNNGILIAIAPKYGKIRIQNGFGIEKFLSDNQTKKIIDSFMVPPLSKGNYFDGTKEGVKAIISALTKHGIK